MEFVEDLRQILADLREFAATRPQSSFAKDKVQTLGTLHETIERLEEELVQRSTMANAGLDVAQLTAQLQALTEQLAEMQRENALIKAQLAASQSSTSAATQATQSAATPSQPIPATRIHNPIKLDLPKFSGDGAGAARDFHRQASMLPSWIENATEEYLINVVATRLTGHAAYWVDQWRVHHPTGSFRDLMTEFKHHFVDSRETQTIARTQLYGSKQLTTIDALYQYMTQRLVVLTEKPKDIDTVTIFIQALKDERVRLEVANKAPATLEDACKIANEAQALQRSVTNPRPANHDQRPRHHDVPQWRPGPPRAHQPPRPHIPRAYAIQPMFNQTQEVRLNRLDDETRQLCREQDLCYWCRKPGHYYKNCPRPNSTANFPPRGAPRRQ